jgi:hypothetical protein
MHTRKGIAHITVTHECTHSSLLILLTRLCCVERFDSAGRSIDRVQPALEWWLVYDNADNRRDTNVKRHDGVMSRHRAPSEVVCGSSYDGPKDET